MAAFGASAYRPLPGRAPAPGFRFTIYALLSAALMFYDERGGVLEKLRFWMQAAAYPVQLAVSSPTAAWRWLEQSFETRASLEAQNALLARRLRELEIRSSRFEELARENSQLRGLREALPPVAEKWLVGEMIDVELTALRQRVIVNKGSRNGVFVGQTVLGRNGLLGQTLHVGPWSSEVILITDAEHAVPIQVLRNGLRSIAVGTGDPGSLALPYLPVNFDIKASDLLVTSGLGGVFPAGYPVARVAEVRRDPAQPLAQVRATPLAAVSGDREVVFIWFRPGHPAAPVNPRTSPDLAGAVDIQPQPPPPRPPPDVAAATTPAAAPPSEPAGDAADTTPPARAPAPTPVSAAPATSPAGPARP